MTDPEDLQYLMSLVSSGDMTPEGCVSVAGRTISWRSTSDSTTRMEVSVSCKRMVSWSGWEWDTESMSVSWIGIGNPSTNKATVSTCRTLYALKDGLSRLVSMNFRRGLPVGKDSSYSLSDMVKNAGFDQKL